MRVGRQRQRGDDRLEQDRAGELAEAAADHGDENDREGEGIQRSYLWRGREGERARDFHSPILSHDRCRSAARSLSRDSGKPAGEQVLSKGPDFAAKPSRRRRDAFCCNAWLAQRLRPPDCSYCPCPLSPPSFRPPPPLTAH